MIDRLLLALAIAAWLLDALASFAVYRVLFALDRISRRFWG